MDFKEIGWVWTGLKMLLLHIIYRAIKAVQAECVPAVFCSGIMHSQLSLVLELNKKNALCNWQYN